MASKDREAQQRSVAVYLIDRLALRVGGEKDTAEEADTVGCCSLRVEHVKDDVPENQLHLNFLGKDSIEYDNTNEIDPRAYKLIHRFMKNKAPGDQLFEHVQPSDLNDYFKSVMSGLSAKVFRTYNASITLCSELQKTANEVTAEQRRREGDVIALCNYYTLANKQVAILCNHQKAGSASHAEQIAKMDAQLEALTAELKQAKKEKTNKVEALQKRFDKLTAARNTKEETKCVSLGTSKINYNDPVRRASTCCAVPRCDAASPPPPRRRCHLRLTRPCRERHRLGGCDRCCCSRAAPSCRAAFLTRVLRAATPAQRITIAWCKTHDVPIQKQFPKTLLAKFAWAMGTEPGFRF